MFIEVRVKANSKQDRVIPADGADGDKILTVELKAPARDGKANTALIRLLARHFDVTQEAVAIKRGATSRNKILEVTL